ncbi:MAG: hypothetical protein U0X73_09855 [Thermoanaerobaculia bacterium]
MNDSRGAHSAGNERCERCDIAMQEGFLLDRGHNHRLGFATWVSGTPVRSWIRGLSLRGTERYEVTTLRCPRCGRLASFARDRAS